MAKMHREEAEIDDGLVRGLVDEQFPRWAALSLKRVASGGTDNAIYRLGDTMAVRLPRVPWAAGQVLEEHRWLPRVAPHLPLATPAPLGLGEPARGYPHLWSVVRWLPGANALDAPPSDLIAAAEALAGFIAALQFLPTTGGPRPADATSNRGGPLAPRDPAVRSALAQLSGLLDTGTAARAWEQSLAAPEWDRAPVWLHGDLHPANMLVNDGQLSAIIDFAPKIGDPAVELIAAWTLLDGPARSILRQRLSIDDATWLRGRGWALSMGLIALPYYMHTNPVLVAISRRAIGAVIADMNG